MKNILIAIALLGMLNACSIGPKCTYTQEGTKITSWVWFYKDKPADLDKQNCNWYKKLKTFYTLSPSFG
jgi:hypothetical protein